jgi:hypothetical protein
MAWLQIATQWILLLNTVVYGVLAARQLYRGERKQGLSDLWVSLGSALGALALFLKASPP